MHTFNRNNARLSSRARGDHCSLHSHDRTHIAGTLGSVHQKAPHLLFLTFSPDSLLLLSGKGLIEAIIRRSEAALQHKKLKTRRSSIKATVLNELFWTPSTHRFYDNTPASTTGFDTVLHVAARLTLREPDTTSASMHLPIELWHHILSFLRRYDLDPDYSLTELLATATIVDTWSYEGGDDPLCPLKLVAMGTVNYPMTWLDGKLLSGRPEPAFVMDVVTLLLDAPSAREGNMHQEFTSMFADQEIRTRTSKQIIEHTAMISARSDGWNMGCNNEAEGFGHGMASDMTKLLFTYVSEDVKAAAIAEFAWMFQSSKEYNEAQDPKNYASDDDCFPGEFDGLVCEWCGESHNPECYYCSDWR